MAWQPRGYRPRQPMRPVSGMHAGRIPPPNELDGPAGDEGVPLYEFEGFHTNPARLNGNDINPNNLQTMRHTYWDGVQLFNGVDGITSKRFGPSQFYLLSDAYPGQSALVPSGKVPSQMLTPSDIQNGPAAMAAAQPAVVSGPVYNGGRLVNPGGC